MPVSLPALPERIRQQSVLLVEDSPFQRELICALLQSLGIHDIRQAGEGRAALAQLRASREALPLLVLDLEMPGMDGIELLQCLAEERIHPQVIIASGREAALISTVESMLHACGMPLLGSLEKPLAGAALHRLLANQRPPVHTAVVSRPPCPELGAADLATAIGRGDIRPYYQPKVALQSGRLIGYEVLARWQHAQAGLLLPGRFIALACRSGLLHELTFSLLQQALQDLRGLGHSAEALHMALNLDISLLADRSFAEQLIARVRGAGSQPGRWILEVTESALMHNPAVTLGSVGRLRLAGFGLSIDDYGTGFSTLQQLSRLPFTELKIDRAFVADAQRNQRARDILQAAIEMGRTLRLPCIAEGIEQREDACLLASLGCFAGQGYLFARPMAGADLPAWHRAHYGCASLAEWFAV